MKEENKEFTVVPKPNTSPGIGPDGEPPIGSTGFYYVTPSDAWDENALSGRKPFTALVTLPSYIWRELLKAMALSLAIFSIILMAVFAGQVMRDGVGAYTLIRILPNFFPLMCPFVLPLAIITGILVCYSRLSKDNEILAAYAGGIHPFWLALPAILTSVVAIFVTLTLNETAMMPAIQSIEQLVIDDQANILRRMISRPGSISVQAGDEYIAMSKMDPQADMAGRSTLDITRFALPNRVPAGGMWDPRYPYPAKRVVARDHAVHDFLSEGGSGLTLKMSVAKPIVEDLHASDINRTFIAYGESGEERVTVGGRPSVTINSGRSTFWPILRLSETRREAETRLWELDSGATRIEELPEARQAELQGLRARYERVIRVRSAEINMRLALCFSCLAFALLGIPLGMRTRSSLVSSFIVGIIVAGLYFLMLKSTEIQVSRGNLPSWMIWVPDAMVVVLGVILWVTVSRKS